MAPVFEERLRLHIARHGAGANGHWTVARPQRDGEEKYAADEMGSFPSAAQRNGPLK
jgi:hypothetical protein